MRCCTGSVWCRSNPGQHALDDADYTAPTRQHELDHTDHTDHTGHTDQESIYFP